MKHILVFDYGMHHVMVEVSEKEFFHVINDLSKEFEIHKNNREGMTEYYIINYYGDKDIRGYISIEQ